MSLSRMESSIEDGIIYGSTYGPTPSLNYLHYVTTRAAAKVTHCSPSAMQAASHHLMAIHG